MSSRDRRRRRFPGHKVRIAVAASAVAGAMFLAAAPTAAVAATTTATWIGAGEGSWGNPARWSTGTVPNNGSPAGTTYDVVIGGNGAVTVASGVFDLTVDSVLLNNAASQLLLTSGTLSAVNGGITVDAGLLYLGGSTLRNTTLTGAGQIRAAGFMSTFDNVTLSNTTLGIKQQFTRNTVRVQNNLTLNNAVIQMDNEGISNHEVLEFLGTHVVAGTGQIVFDGVGPESHNHVAPRLGANLTLAAGITIRTGASSGDVNRDLAVLINHGTISAQTAGKFIDVYDVTNDGTLETKNGSTLNLLGGAWSNPTGTIVVNGGTLNFAGTDNLAALGNVVRTGGTVNYAGTLNNAGNTIDLAIPAGGLNLSSGARVNGGTLTNSSATFTPQIKLSVPVGDVPAPGPVTLVGITLDTDLVVSAGGALLVQGGLTLANGSVVSIAGDAVNLGNSVVNFSGTQTLGGSGAIVFDGASAFDFAGSVSGTLTVGSGITVRTGAGGGTFGDSRGALVNQGTIAAQTAGKTLRIGADTWTNTGTLRVDAGTLDLGGVFTTAGIGTVVRGGGTLMISGALNNAGATLNLNAIGPVTLANGSISGGRIEGSAANAIHIPYLPTVYDAGFLGGNAVVAATINVGDGGRLKIKDGLTLDNATINLARQGDIYAFGPLAIGGTGEIVFAGGYPYTNASLTGVTFGSGITVRNKPGAVEGGYALYANGATNNGIISSEVAGQGVLVSGYPTVFTNNGTLRALNGGTLDVGNFTNNGAITASGGALGLSNLVANTGTITAVNTAVTLADVATPAIGSFSRTGGSMKFTGTLNNAGATLNLDNGFGPTTFEYLRVTGGGTISGTGANRVNIVGGTAFEGGVNLAANVDVGDRLTIRDGLTLNNVAITLVNSGGDDIVFEGTQTIGGTGEIVFAGSSQGAASLQTLTIGSGVTLRSGTQGAFISHGNFTNNGTIRSNVAGKNLSFTSEAVVTNNGTVEALNGGVLTLSGTWNNNGSITVANSTLNLGGFVTGPGTFSVTNSNLNVGGTRGPAQFKALPFATNTVTLTGTIDAGGGTFDLDAGTGSIRINNGTLKNGRFAAAAGLQYNVGGAAGATVFLDGVTLAAPLVAANQTNVSVVNNPLTLDSATITLGSTALATRMLVWGGGTVGGNGTILFGGTVAGGTNGNGLMPASSGTLTLAPGITVATGTGGGVIGDSVNTQLNTVNDGVVSARTAGKTITLAGKNFTNNGTVEARNGGVIQLGTTTTLTNLASNTLTGGNYFVGAGSTINFAPRTFTTNAAKVTLDGPNSTFFAVNPITTNAAAGTFEIDNGRNFTTAGSLANAGTLRVGKDSTLTVNGTLTNTGKIKGKGTIVAANVNSSGSIEPGESAGVLSITGNLAMTASSTLEIEIGGTTPGVDYDILDVSGAFTLDGTLKITLVNGFSPDNDDAFDFLDFASAGGTFDSVILPALPPGVEWDTATLASGGPAGVPEPSACGLALVAAGAALLRRRRRRRPA